MVVFPGREEASEKKKSVLLFCMTGGVGCFTNGTRAQRGGVDASFSSSRKHAFCVQYKVRTHKICVCACSGRQREGAANADERSETGKSASRSFSFQFTVTVTEGDLVVASGLLAQHMHCCSLGRPSVSEQKAEEERGRVNPVQPPLRIVLFIGTRPT